MRPLLATMLAVCVLSFPALAQESRPSQDLVRENAELKARIEKLEKYVEQLEARLRAQEPLRPKMLPGVPPYGFELPALPFKQPVLPKATPPAQPRLLPAPTNPPGNWERREFNGQEYYLIPLR